MKESFNDSDWDRLIKERFTEHKVEPSEKTWKALHIYVENMLADKRKRRAVWLRLLSFLLLLMLLSLAIYELTRDESRTIADNKKNTLPIIQQKSNTKTEKQTNFIINDVPGKSQKDDVLFNEKNINLSVLSKDKMNEQPSQQQHESSYTNTFAKSTSLAHQSKTDNSSVRKIEEQKKSDESNSNSPNSAATTTEDVQVKNDTASQKTISNEIVVDNQTKKNAVLPSVTDSIITQLQDSVALVENTIRSIDSLTKNKKTPAQSESATEIKANSFRRFSLEATFSPEYVNRLLTNTSTNNGSGKTAEYYNNIEKPVQPTYTAHLKIGYLLSNRWKMQLGVGYNYFSQKSNLISDTLGSLQSDAHTCLIETSAGRINFSSSLFHPFINHPEKTPITYRTSEKYEYLTIPLLFQYVLKEGKTTWIILTGVSANVLLKSTLRLDINNNNTVIFNNINGLQKTNFSFIIGAGMERDLWRRFYFSLMPTIKGTFTPINKGTSVKTYPYYVGLQLGLGYRF